MSNQITSHLRCVESVELGIIQPVNTVHHFPLSIYHLITEPDRSEIMTVITLKNPHTVNLCVFLWVCASSISSRHSGTTASHICSPLISLLTSPSLISSCYHPEKWDWGRMLARKPAPSRLSPGPSHLSLPLSDSFLSLSRLAFTVADECGAMERDWTTVLLSHSNWAKDLADVLPPPPVCLPLSQTLVYSVTLYRERWRDSAATTAILYDAFVYLRWTKQWTNNGDITSLQSMNLKLYAKHAFSWFSKHICPWHARRHPRHEKRNPLPCLKSPPIRKYLLWSSIPILDDVIVGYCRGDTLQVTHTDKFNCDTNY